MKTALIGSFLLPSESIRHQGARRKRQQDFITWTEIP
jgi:hypothetical protein